MEESFNEEEVLGDKNEERTKRIEMQMRKED